MRILDANVLLYAVDTSSPRHKVAREWVDEKLSGIEPVGFVWVVLLAVIRLSTSRAVFANPLDADEAMDLVEGWLRQPCSTTVQATDAHPVTLRRLLATTGTAGNLTTDAHLAALALEHGATLTSFDGDFHRFSGLRFEHLA